MEEDLNARLAVFANERNIGNPLHEVQAPEVY